ncbi:hypothetical protein KDL01_04580 [Actinospica durhamensis]|uniref:WD40 repeat domain-containing protein n=1 Tax=Actinospica durhamensis TaxID=1508375 RepID=A0A941EH59_9ACTN|nr:hypothetical protein [Actinospica durhamensis]MBR7832520.1 hypothetical protein [Actinospica durhamensis]
MSELPAAAAELEITEAWTADAPTGGRVLDVAYADIDGRAAAVAVTADALLAWDLDSAEPILRAAVPEPGPRRQATELCRVAVTDGADGPVAVTGDDAGGLQAWDLRSGERLRGRFGEYGRLRELAARQGAGAGRVLVARGAGASSSVYANPVGDGLVELWGVGLEPRVKSLPHGGFSVAVAVGEHDGRALAVVSAEYSMRPLIDSSDAEGKAYLWDLETGGQVGEVLLPVREGDLIGSVAVGAVDGRTLVVGVSNGLSVWEIGRPGSRPHSTVRPPGRIDALAWTGGPDRPLLLAGGGGPRMQDRSRLQVWDARDWRLLGEARPGWGTLNRLAAAPDARVIVPWNQAVRVLRYRVAD